MSITCSIPGCNKRTSLSDETKLYRVPALAICSSEPNGLISNERRKKWFEVLEMYGLNEDNAASYRVCSNHFKDGKPSPMSDSKSVDWAPSINLPFSANVIEEIVEVEDNKEKRRRERQNKRDTRRRNSSDSYRPVRSKSVERSRLRRRTTSSARSKSVCGSKLIKSDNSSERKSSDQPFVFVDIQKIKEGTPIAFRGVTPRPQSPKENNFDIKNQSKSDCSRCFGTQTNLNVLPSLNCDGNKLREQHDSQYQTLGVQTDPISMRELFVSDNSFQACLGEMIEFVRMQMLDYNLKALGKGFKIKECALHFQKEGDEVDKVEEANTVVVHPTKLLSSNWELLEAVAMSLDLYRLQDKNVKSCYSRTLNGKRETIEKISNDFDGNEPWRNQLKEIDKSNEYALGEIITNDDENGNQTGTESPIGSTDKTAISPVLPRITSVISIGELLKDSTTSRSPSKRNAFRKKLATVTVPSPKSISTVTRVKPRNSSVVRKNPPSNLAYLISSTRRRKKIPYIRNKRRTRLENNTVIQGILGTSKVPRVVLSKLPDTVFENGGRVPLCSVLNYKNTHRNSIPNKSKTKLRAVNDSSQLLGVPGSSCDRSSLTRVSQSNKMKNTPVSFKSVKNIPLKLPQSSGVAGYLLVPDANVMGGKAPLMYVPKPNVQNDIPKMDNFNQNNYDELTSVQTPTKSGSNLANIPDGVTNAHSELTQDNIAQLGSSRVASDINRVIHPPKIKLTDPKIANVTEPKVTKVAIPKLSRKRGPSKKIQVSRRRKKNYNRELNDLEPIPKDNINEVQLAKSHIVEGIPNGGEALLRCPYCLKNCKDGLDFINHHKTTGCKGKKNLLPIKTINSKRGMDIESIHDCNVCGNVFVNQYELNNHLQIHMEYEVWDKKCAECPKKFATPEELRDHVSERHSWKIKIAKFECKECEKCFTTRKRLECHIEKKHPSTVKKGCNIKINCKFCQGAFELEHYRQVHWRECQKREGKEKIREYERTDEINDNSLEETFIVDDKVKDKAQRDIMKVNVMTRNSEDDKLLSHQVNSEVLELQRKPTAIRTFKKDSLNDDLEAQLSRMFQEDSSEDSSPSDYEQEELLAEGYEDEVLTGKKTIENEVNGLEKERCKRMKRLLNWVDTNSNDENFELPPVKISKVDEDIEKEGDELLNSNLIKDESKDRQKIDIKSLLNVDDSTNDIVIEEIEDSEYFSIDMSAQ